MNPLDSDLSDGQRYPAFEQLGPGSFINIRHILTGFHHDPMVFLIKTTLSEALVGRLSHVKHQLDSRKRNDFLKLCLEYLVQSERQWSNVIKSCTFKFHY